MPRPLALVAIAAFVVVDLALIAAAVDKVHSEPPASPTVAASPTGGDEQISAQTAFDFMPRSAGSLYVRDDSRLITSRRGACRDGSAGEVRTADSRRARLTERDTGLREVLAVRVDGDQRYVVAGADETCTVRQRSSADGGQTWVDDPEVSLWHVERDNGRAVTTPRGTTEITSCTIISLTQVDSDFGRVACADGSIFGTGDQGGDWTRLGRLDNVRVISFPSPDEGYALARYQGCAANAFRTADGGRTWKALDCITGDPARAIGATDDGLTAIVGDRTSLYTSPDGRDWEPR